MLNASNKKPITGERKAHLEDLRINHVPQFLFRTWSSQSGGGPKLATNSVEEIVPHGYMKKSTRRGFYEVPENELQAMVRDHYQGTYRFTEFSSWTGSLHLALCYAEIIGEQHDPHIAVMDTKQLGGDVLVWHVPHLFPQAGLHEYMAHGPIKGIGYKAVSYNTLKSVGLMQVFPELIEQECHDWGASLRRKMFEERPKPFLRNEMEQSDEMKQIRRIADLYDHLSLPVATALICLRPRLWVHSRPQGRAALDDVAELFDTAKLPKGLAGGNWLRKGVVDTGISSSDMGFPDVQQWIELLQAICERPDQSAEKLGQPKKKSEELPVEDVPAAKQSMKKRPRGKEEDDEADSGKDWGSRLRPRKKMSYAE